MATMSHLDSSGTCFSCSCSIPKETQPPYPSDSAKWFLKNNNVLSDSDHQLFRPNLVEVKARLSGVTDRIRLLEENLSLLRNEQRLLRDASDAYSTILGPVRSLPDEVLREIFLQACVTSVDMMDSRTPCQDTLDPKGCHWTLGQVCRRWRAVILCPTFWTCIGIILPITPQSQACLDVYSHRLALQIQRAGNRPITISIKADDTVSEHHPLLLLAFSRSTRWHALRLSMEYHTLTRISPMLKGNMPSLRRLLLEVNDKTRPLHDDVIVNAFQDAPELQDVSLDGNIEFLVPLIPMPWSQITHYRDLWDITWRSWPDNAEILRETPNLTHLFGSYWWLDRHPPITMPHLHTLSLYSARIDPDNESSDTFLDQLNAPRVRNLCISGTLTTLSIEAYRRFMDRSASTLRAVSVDTQAWPKASRESLVLDLLKSIPDRVESLTLRDRMTEHWIIEALTLKLDGCNEDGRPRILPRLQDLRLYVFPDPHCDVLVNQLISMVESRIPSESGPGLLKKLRLDLRGRTRRILGAPYFKEKVLQSNGLEVDLSPPAWDRYFPIF